MNYSRKQACCQHTSAFLIHGIGLSSYFFHSFVINSVSSYTFLHFRSKSRYTANNFKKNHGRPLPLLVALSFIRCICLQNLLIKQNDKRKWRWCDGREFTTVNNKITSNSLITRFDASYIVLSLSALVILNRWCRDKKKRKKRKRKSWENLKNKRISINTD